MSILEKVLVLFIPSLRNRKVKDRTKRIVESDRKLGKQLK